MNITHTQLIDILENRKAYYEVKVFTRVTSTCIIFVVQRTEFSVKNYILLSGDGTIGISKYFEDLTYCLDELDLDESVDWLIDYLKDFTWSGRVYRCTENLKIADEVMIGKWGNGEERKRKLEAAGYDYDTIQQLVNDLINYEARG